MKKARFNTAALTSAALVVTMGDLIVPTTMAQTHAPERDSGVLEEVLVTATRRVESLQEVPVAVSAIAGETLAKSGIFETSDLDRIVPNLQVSSVYGKTQPNFSLRGVGVGTEYNANAASPIGVYVDEVYQTFRASHGQQLYDLKQIEVLRGPQGTLFGRNTTGGAINFITRKPELTGTNGTLAVGFGNYSRKTVEGAIELTPVDDTFGIRLAGTYEESDPTVENKLPAGLNTSAAGGASGLNFNSGIDPGGYENYGVRGTFRLAPTRDVDLMLKVYKAESKGGTEGPLPTGQSKNNDVIDYENPNFLLAPFFQGLAPLGLLPSSYSQKANGLDKREIQTDGVGDAKTTAEGVVFTANLALNEDLDFIAVAGYDSGKYQLLPTYDCDATPLALCNPGYDSDFDAYNLDVRFDYTSGPLKLIVGAFYGKDSIDNDNRPNFFGFLSDIRAAFGLPPSYFNPGGAFSGAGLSPTSVPTGLSATQHFKQERESWALYGEGNYDLTDTITLTAGLRYSDDTNDYSEGISAYLDDTGTPRMLTVSDYQVGGVYSPYFLEDVLDEAGNVVIPASPSPEPGGLKRSGDSDDWSGRVIVDWKPTDEVMLYASYSRGYRSGTFNGLAYQTAYQVYFVDPEEVDAYEAGVKSRLMEDRLQVNASAFYYDYAGQQNQLPDSSGTAQVITLDGTSYGIELEAQFLVSDRLTLTAAAGWLDTEYDDGKCPDTPITGFPSQVGNCVESAVGPINVGGNPFPFAAEESVNLGFDWDIADIGEGTLTLHGEAAYTGQYYFDFFKDYKQEPLPNLQTGKFTEGEADYWTANASLTYATGSYSVMAWVKNLTDEDYYPFGIGTENLFGVSYRVIAPPRTYGMEFRYSF